MLTSQVAITKVRARCPAPTEALPARLRLAHLLRNLDIAPPGFPPQAILVVRRVVAPGELSMSGLHAQGGWERGVRESLTDVYHRAARPVCGQVPESVEAVLFRDMGELLACLGISVRGRNPAQLWYWQAVWGSPAKACPQALAQAWAESPRFTPAAIQYLVEWGQAAAVLQTLSSTGADAILSALGAEFGLPAETWRGPAPSAAPAGPDLVAHTAFPESAPPIEASAAPGRPPPISASSLALQTGDGEIGRQPAPPWARWRPRAPADWQRLAPLGQRLLGLAVALFHEPSWARTPRFAREMQAWFEQSEEPSSRMPHGASTRGAEPLAARVPEGQPNRAQAFMPGNQTPPPSPGPVGTADRSPTLPITYSNEGGVTSPIGAGATVRVERLPEPPPTPAFGPAAPRRPGEPGPGATEATEQDRPPPPWSGLQGFDTRLGGILYLLNLFAQLRLPECFDDDGHLSQRLSGWGMADLLGRALLHPLGADQNDDPLWMLLQHLDGREAGEPAASHFQAGDTYRMPAFWLARYVPSDEPWQAEQRAGRLRVCHRSGGFLIVDRPASGDGGADLAAQELAGYQAQGLSASLRYGTGQQSRRDGSRGQARGRGEGKGTRRSARSLSSWPAPHVFRSLPPSLRRWVGWTFPFLHYLLIRVLGAEAWAEETLARRLLLKRGRVYCTATHVDLVMDLDQISLPIRRAGLDTNPGWVPGLMRVVTFHYL